MNIIFRYGNVSKTESCVTVGNGILCDILGLDFEDCVWFIQIRGSESIGCD